MGFEYFSCLAELASTQHGAVARRQLDALGLTREAVRHLVRRGVLAPVGRDVFVVAATPDIFHRRVWCALLSAGPGAVASHRLAARLHRMRGFANEGSWPVIRVTWRDLTRAPERFAAAISRVLGVPVRADQADQTASRQTAPHGACESQDRTPYGSGGYGPRFRTTFD